MVRTRAIKGVKAAGSDLALNWALRWHLWRLRTRLRLVRLLLSLELGPDKSSVAHRHGV